MLSGVQDYPPSVGATEFHTADASWTRECAQVATAESYSRVVEKRCPLVVILAAFLLSSGGACTEGGVEGDWGGSPLVGADGGALDADRLNRFGCAEAPNAFVFTGGVDPAVSHPALTARLVAAGFQPASLPLDQSPFELKGVAILPSGSSASPAYAPYMAAHAQNLYAFVDKANVLVQLPQLGSVEPTPPFLPTTHTARRGGATVASAFVYNAENPLLAGMTITADGRLGWAPGQNLGNVFDEQGGFEVALAADVAGNAGVLLEGAYGQGRIVLSALAFDAVSAGDVNAPAADAFFRNLRGHVQAVCARQVPALKITATSYQRLFTPGSSFLAVLPDTQVYSLLYPGVFLTQTSWLATHARELDIRYVLHLGDIVNNNTPLEWSRAASAMSILDGVIPYALVGGNHDYGPSGDASTRQTFLNDFFAFEKAAAMPSFGGAFEPGKLDNTYHFVTVGTHQFLILALEWGPRNAVIDWANVVMGQHPMHEGILVTHAYLNNNDRRYDHRDRAHPQHFNPHEYATPDVNDGEELWQKLVRRHNFVLTFNGHVLGDGTGYLVSTTDTGRRVHQMLSNYQMRNLGGEGYMRLVEFLPDNRTVHVWSYSPLFDRFMPEPDQNFVFTLD